MGFVDFSPDALERGQRYFPRVSSGLDRVGIKNPDVVGYVLSSVLGRFIDPNLFETYERILTGAPSIERLDAAVDDITQHDPVRIFYLRWHLGDAALYLSTVLDDAAYYRDRLMPVGTHSYKVLQEILGEANLPQAHIFLYLHMYFDDFRRGLQHVVKELVVPQPICTVSQLSDSDLRNLIGI